MNALAGLLFSKIGLIFALGLLASCDGGSGGNDNSNSVSNRNLVLSNLTFQGGVLSPAFQGSTKNYTLTVADASSSSFVTPTILEW